MLRVVVLIGLVCGLSQAYESRIVGGSNATIQDFPYTLAFFKHGQPNCGAVIISENYALTAAQCTSTLSFFTHDVRAGSTHYGFGGQFIRGEVTRHPRFNESAGTVHDYDVAVIALNEPLKLGEGVQPIRLPKLGQEVKVGSIGTLTGWGVTKEGGYLSPILQQVDLPIVSREVCDEAMNSPVTENMICAGHDEGGKDGCQGDAGSPLVIDGVLVGLGSWGRGCGRAGYPGVYTNVAALRDFIKAETGL